MTNRKHPTSPTPYSYWAITDKLLAGEYPGDQHPRNYFRTLVSKVYSILGFLSRPNQGMMNSDKRIKAILDAGINTFLDLTELNELPEYERKLNAINDSDNASIKYKRMAIKDRNVPKKEFLKEILDFIDEESKNNRKIYVHCLRGLGRTGTIVGCYLVREGFKGEEALQEIFKLRQGMLNAWMQSPQTEEQIQTVINWVD
tara:strand:- start:51 stop:653 length:603 start_codon:yes stop_codon:yes gene_type:complete